MRSYAVFLSLLALTAGCGSVDTGGPTQTNTTRRATTGGNGGGSVSNNGSGELGTGSGGNGRAQSGNTTRGSVDRDSTMMSDAGSGTSATDDSNSVVADAGSVSAGDQSGAQDAGTGSSVDNGNSNSNSNSNGGMSDAGTGGGSSGQRPDYACNEILGVWLTGQWYNAGFESGVPADRWQLKSAHGAYVEAWANPGSQYWGTAPTSPCAMNSNSPDRVIFVAANWTFTTQAQWEAAVTKAVGTIKTKYPQVRNIELVASIRCPDKCGTRPAPPKESCFIAKMTDDALTAVAAKMPDLVTVGPKFEEDCPNWTDPVNSTHLTPAGNKAAAKQVSDWYSVH